MTKSKKVYPRDVFKLLGLWSPSNHLAILEVVSYFFWNLDLGINPIRMCLCVVNSPLKSCSDFSHGSAERLFVLLRKREGVRKCLWEAEWTGLMVDPQEGVHKARPWFYPRLRWFDTSGEGKRKEQEKMFPDFGIKQEGMSENHGPRNFPGTSDNCWNRERSPSLSDWSRRHSGVVWQLMNLHIDETAMKTSVSLLLLITFQ